MSSGELQGWDRIRHGGLLLDAQRLREVAASAPDPLFSLYERDLRKRASAILDDGDVKSADVSSFVSFVMQQICGFTESTGGWQRGPQVPSEWGRTAITGETVKPRHLWEGHRGGVLPVFLDREKRVGIGRGRKATSQVLQWLRAGDEQLGLITNGRQWRLVFAGLDFDAWCEWDLDLWLEEGDLSPQVTALRTLLQPALWTPKEKNKPAPLLQAVLDSRKGQAELSQVLGERVREAVEILLQGHGEGLKERCGDVDPADIYRAAVRMVMRMVVVLFAESRELLPRDNALYHGAYGLGGLLEELEKVAARGGNRLTRTWCAWPRVLALFHLVHQGSHHPSLPVPPYGGELFAQGDSESPEGLIRALSVFENACFEHEVLPDRDVHRVLDRITRTRVKLRQGRSNIWVPAPVDFSDLSSEYIGILYEGLLDFELKTAPSGDPVIFLAVGNQPALPLSRLEEMDDKALKDLLEQLKDTSSSDDGAGESEEDAEEAESEEDEAASEEPEDDEAEPAEVEGEDERHTTRTRAEVWARRAAEVGNLVRKPRGRLTPEKRLAFEETVARKARQLVMRVVLPGEWYLVRWGGTRKGSGTFYTRPGLAVPTVQRTLRPLAWNPPAGAEAKPGLDAPPANWRPKKPEEILKLKVVDPACGSGTFPVAALRFLTDALYASLHHHERIHEQGDRAVVALLNGPSVQGGAEERLCEELLPCRPDDEFFEPRLKAVLRRHVVERCIYGVDLDPLAVELCRLALWVETMDRTLPFSFLDHKVKCGNGLVGTWFDQFQHYPAMAWKNREGGDKSHSNGVHFEKGSRTKAIKAFVKDTLQSDLATHLAHHAWEGVPPEDVHDEALAVFEELHAMPVVDAGERARLYRDRLLGDGSWQQLKAAFDRWCACWFWPPDRLDCAPLPSNFASPSSETREVTEELARAKGFFHWELEFPDVFQASHVGFHAVMGNPPWEIAKPNSKEFFSNIDPLYRAYGKQEALRKQTNYFAAEETERSWLDYNADFRAQSNLLKYAANPSGDPDWADKSQDRFALARGRQNEILHQEWRKTRAATQGYAESRHPFRHQGSADINLYKLFLEQAHALLEDRGRLGFIVPSGLYSDHGTGELRKLFLEHCSWEWLFGFENRDAIFDIHRAFKFNPIIIEKGSHTEAIRTAFMRRKLEDWEHADEYSTLYSIRQLRTFSPGRLAVLEIRDHRDLSIMEAIYKKAFYLASDDSGWGVEYSREFHLTDDSKHFPPIGRWEEDGYRESEYGHYFNEGGERAFPVYEGRLLDQFDFSAMLWIRGKGRSATWDNNHWESKRSHPQYLMSEAFYEASGQRFSFPKLAVMEVTSATNSRTIVAALTPRWPGGHKTPFMASGSRPYVGTAALCALLNSLSLDFVARRSVGAMTLGWYVIENLPLPSPSPALSARLAQQVVSQNCAHSVMANYWLPVQSSFPSERSWRENWAVTPAERLRRKCIVDAICMCAFGFTELEAREVLRDCDLSTHALKIRSSTLDPKGFWRIDKGKDPELRHTVLSFVAFRDLQQLVERSDGDREDAIDHFCAQNGGEGWMLPKTLRLSDYNLGDDDRAEHPQSVASRLGPRFHDWQLAQSVEESWRECHQHTRNLLGEAGYQQLLEEIEHGTGAPTARKSDQLPLKKNAQKSSQGDLFE